MKKRIIILGGGFAGLYTALQLDKTIAKDSDIEVILVNEENFILFTPMLHEVAASDLDVTHIVNPIRKMLKRVTLFHGSVEDINLNEKYVKVTHGESHFHSHTLEYDQLIISLGSITNYFNIPGLQQNALTMKSLADAIELRNKLIEYLEEADFECSAGLRNQYLTVCVAGGGFAGVETIAGVNDFLRDAIKFYPNLSEELIKVVLIHPGKFILPELGEKLGRYAQKKLSERKVEIRVNTRVTGYSENGVELNDGTIITARTLVWTAGTSPNPLLSNLSCVKEKGKIKTNSFLEVEGFPGVWAIGDCASTPDKDGNPYPPTAQHAIRAAKILGRNITASIRGGEKKPFIFSTIGQLAAIGKRTGVANIFGINFSGFIAWWLWRSIYLSKLPRFEKKLRVAIDWTLDLIFSKDLVQFKTQKTSKFFESEKHVSV